MKIHILFLLSLCMRTHYSLSIYVSLDEIRHFLIWLLPRIILSNSYDRWGGNHVSCGIQVYTIVLEILEGEMSEGSRYSQEVQIVYWFWYSKFMHLWSIILNMCLNYFNKLQNRSHVYKLHNCLSSENPYQINLSSCWLWFCISYITISCSFFSIIKKRKAFHLYINFSLFVILVHS